jgi:hypothetical protein
MNRLKLALCLAAALIAAPHAQAQSTRNFSKDVRIVPILSYASGTADRTSSVVDTKGYEGAIIVVHFAAIAAGGTNSVFIQHADAASNSTTLTSGADVATSLQTVADDDDNEVKYIDVFRPGKRFIQLNVDKDTTNACAESAVAYLYRGNARPAIHAEGTGTSGGADIAEGELMVSPASGTK